MNMNREHRIGERFVYVETFLWSFLPIISVLSFASVPVLTSLAWSTLCAVIFLAAVVSYNKAWHEVFQRKIWLHVLLAAIFIDMMYFGLYFIGLEKTTPGNAVIIALFEVFTSYLVFNIFRRQHIAREHKLGATLMLVGAMVVLAPNYSGIHTGDFIILAATFFAPVGNYFQLRARKKASSATIMFMRALCAAPVLFLAAYVLGERASFENLQSAIVFLVLNGVVMLGISRILWLEGIRRIAVVDAIALSCIGPLLTLFFAWLILGQLPNVWQLSALVPLTLGILYLTDRLKFR